MTMGHVIALLGLLFTVAGALVAFGVLKAKAHAALGAASEAATRKELAAAAAKGADALAAATRRGDEMLAAAMRRSDDLLEQMRRSAEQDRERWDREHAGLREVVSGHGERIAALEVSNSQLFKMMDKLEATVTNGFRELRDELRELRGLRSAE